MCGIAGYYAFEGTFMPSREILEKMTDAMRLRGPDDKGIYIDTIVGLGNRRLIIQDLSEKGHMPMSNEEESIWITYNGEVYNFKELRKELEGKGHRFRSRTDTEVVIHAYEEYGINCIHKFNGMFAFALWDKKRKQFYLVRDRLGIKPLFYSFINNDLLLFASSIPSLLQHPAISSEMNPKALFDYFLFRYPLGDKTFINAIKKLMPGYYLAIENGKWKIEQYWDIPYHYETEEEKEHFYIKKVRDCLFESVKKRMISDVPLCAYLSGGLDSSVIVSIMSEISASPVRTYSVGFEYENEFEYARQIADQFDSIHTEITMDAEEYFQDMDDLIEYRGEPLAVPNEVALFRMSKILRKDATVVLSGEGADEIFCGYGRIFRSPFDYQRMNWKIPHVLKNHLFGELINRYPGSASRSEMDFFLYRYSYHSVEEIKRLFHSDLREIIEEEVLFIKDFFEDHFMKVQSHDFYDKISYLFEKIHLPGLLSRVDNATMTASVEGRVPFVDHEFVTFVLNMPLRYRLKWKKMGVLKSLFQTSDYISELYDIPKYALKEAFKNKLPQKVVYRKKKAFPVPLNQWFNSEWQQKKENILDYHSNGINHIFDERELKRKILSGNNDVSNGLELWMLLNINIWYEKFIR